jgi:hypothetical protein
MPSTQLSPAARERRALESFVRHLQRQRAAHAQISAMIANAIGRVSMSRWDKPPTDPVVKARRKAQRRARAITRRSR